MILAKVKRYCVFFFSSRRRHTRCALVTGVQTCALPISLRAGNPYSPFDDDVTLNRYVENAPLEQTNRSITSHAGVTLNGSIDTNWRWTVTGKYDRIDSKSFTDLGVDPSGLAAALAAGDPAVNPFGPLLPPLIEQIGRDHV